MNYDSLNLSGKKVLVLGLGDTGLACARWLAARGAQVSVADSRAAPPHAGRLAELLPQVPLFAGAFDDARLRAAELLVVSPGVPLADPAVAARHCGWRRGGGRCRAVRPRHRGAQRATRHLIRYKWPDAADRDHRQQRQEHGHRDVRRHVPMAGLETCVAGNIGLPVLDALVEIEEGRAPAPQVWVLELSSFQLETTRQPECHRRDRAQPVAKTTWIAMPTWPPTPRPRRGFSAATACRC